MLQTLNSKKSIRKNDIFNTQKSNRIEFFSYGSILMSSLKIGGRICGNLPERDRLTDKRLSENQE